VSKSSTFLLPGDSVGLDALMAKHEGLVRWVVRRQWLGGLTFEEALHEGRIGLWHALQRYDPSVGTRFSTYAVPAITRAVWAAVARHRRGLSASTSSLAPMPGSDPVENIHRTQTQAALLQSVNQLPERLRQVIVAHHGLHVCPPQTFATIGANLGLTRQRIHQLHLKAVLWLAHPAHSLPLRFLLDRHGKADYAQALSRQRQWARLRHQPRRRPSKPAPEVQP
jgi:RNA polymerase sigma factor (sigma-70 family)